MNNDIFTKICSSGKYSFGTRSRQALATVVPELSLVAHRAISLSPIDFAIVEGSRSIERQRELYNSGASKTLHSKHCEGRAIDIAPWLHGVPDYGAVNDCCFLVGLFYGLAKMSGLELRTGALWDGDSIKNNRFIDVWHIETL
jgi:peptidoglycan L-alanyl-D-glutamate endopeptidase CwlK